MSNIIFVSCNGEKTYADLKIDWIKKYGVLNMWRNYCNENGLTYGIQFS